METKSQRGARAPGRVAGVGAVALGLCLGSSAWAAIPGTTLEPYAWFRADAITGIADGGDVATWADSSVNGRNATQNSNNLRRPSYRADGIAAGVPSVRFNINGDATNEFLAFAGPVANTAASAMTAFVVAVDSGGRTGGTAARGTLISTRQGAAPTTNNGFVFGFGANPDVANYAQIGKAIEGGGTVQASPMIGRGVSLLAVTRDGLTSTLESYAGVNGTANTVTWDGFLASGQATTQIGTEAGANYFNGDIAEIVIFGSALDGADHDAVTSYLGDKYGVAVPEPTAVTGLAGLAGWLMMRRRVR